MHVKQKEKDGVVICYIDGEINIDTVDALKKTFKDIVTKKTKKVLLNLERIEYIDSLGLASLMNFSKQLEKANGRMILSNIPPKITSIFKITKADEIFKIYENESEALGNF